MPSSFSAKLISAFNDKGNLCVGIDPHEDLLLENGFELSSHGLREFSQRMLDSLSGQVSIIKPQVSFFERFGPEGFLVLQDLLAQANQMGFLVIADAKRGDIGSTMQAYADAWLGKNAPFICDALTLSPFLGVGSLQPAISAASERGKGLFLLSATSNPEASSLQKAISGGKTVASLIAEEVFALNKLTAQSASEFGNIGLVVGATISQSDYGLDFIDSGQRHKTPILAPGFGAQGAKLEDAKEIFGTYSGNVIYSVSRSALRDGIQGLKNSVAQDRESLAKALG